MRLYWEVAVRGYRRYATYRGATIAGVFTNTVFGFMRAYVYLALFASREEVGGFDVSDTLTYTFATQGMLMVAYIWGWWEVALTIRSGDVVTDLSRPIDYQLYWLAQDLGRATYHAIFRGIPPFVIAALVFDLRLPEHPATWLLFVLSVYLAVCVSFAMRFMVNLSAFWLMDYRGVGGLMAAAWTFLSGFAVPLTFFPDGLRQVVWLLPFAGLVQIPVQIFLEKGTAGELGAMLALQAGWAVLLFLAARTVLGAATRKVVIQGG
jgi:ABC-2 type transport system permease protein